MHYVSKLTATKIIHLIRTHFVYFQDFTNYADLGVGIPYLAGAIKSYFPHVNVMGVDLPDPVEQISNKIKAMGNRCCEALQTMVFSSFDVITDIHNKDYHRELKYLRNCQVITNFIGILEANESVIKYVLPNSLARIVMFRVTSIEIPRLHHNWLMQLKFALHPNRIKGNLAEQVCQIDYFHTRMKAFNSL